MHQLLFIQKNSAHDHHVRGHPRHVNRAPEVGEHLRGRGRASSRPSAHAVRVLRRCSLVLEADSPRARYPSCCHHSRPRLKTSQARTITITRKAATRCDFRLRMRRVTDVIRRGFSDALSLSDVQRHGARLAKKEHKPGEVSEKCPRTRSLTVGSTLIWTG